MTSWMTSIELLAAAAPVLPQLASEDVADMSAHPLRQSFDGATLEIALVNNMPDAAIEATKSQFVDL